MDFHVGSVESLFPHDENENALFTAATGKPVANAWLHCERVLKEGRPLKEAGQVTVRDLMAQGYRGEEVRYFLLAAHYRKPLAVSDEQPQGRGRRPGPAGPLPGAPRPGQRGGSPDPGHRRAPLPD